MAVKVLILNCELCGMNLVAAGTRILSVGGPSTAVWGNEVSCSVPLAGLFCSIRMTAQLLLLRS